MKKKLLFVCTGNTCRSPLAKVFSEAALAQAEISQWTVDSAGLFAFSGQSASGEALATAREFGLDLSLHQSKPVSEKLLAEADLVLVMTGHHKQALLSGMPQFVDKVYTLTAFVEESGDVADPFGGGPAEYQQAAQELTRLITRLVEKMKE